MYTQLLKCSYTLYVVPYPTENYKQWLHNGISWLFIDLLLFWPYDASFPALYDVAVSWLRLKTLIDCIPHPYWMYTKCFSTWRCCRWAYGCTLMPYHYMCRWGLISGEKEYGRACMMLWCHGRGWNPHWLHPTSILDASILDVYKEF